MNLTDALSATLLNYQVKPDRISPGFLVYYGFSYFFDHGGSSPDGNLVEKLDGLWQEMKTFLLTQGNDRVENMEE